MTEEVGDMMRAIECPCGHHPEGADDEQLFRLAREHVDRDHPEMRRTDEEIASASPPTPTTCSP
jgi:hypothetical protein